MTAPGAAIGGSRTGAAGFTLLELVVVMGILAGFLVMLVQFVDAGVVLFSQGEAGQAMADRAMAATRAVRGELQRLRGPSRDLEPNPVPDRLLVQWLPYGLYAGARPTDPHAQFLRATAQLDAADELRLRTAALRAVASAESTDAAAVEARLQQLLATTPLVGHGGLWLFPWPQGDADGSYLQLRLARFLDGQLLPRGDEFVDPMREPVPGSPELPAALVQAVSQPLLQDLLHFELWFPVPGGDGWEGAERVFDSARAGWLGGGGPEFRRDLGPESLADATDDVFPHAIRVVLVVGPDPELAADGLLAADLGPDDRVLRLVNPDRFPGPADGGFVKIGPEWLRYGQFRGDELRALQRAQRGTGAGLRPQGSRVRTGRTVEFTVPMPCGKDDFHG